MRVQRDWDLALLAGWRADHFCQILVHKFMQDHNLTNDEFSALKRVPLFKQRYMPIRAFVASAMPSLSSHLWEGATDDQLVPWMRKVKLRAGMPNRSVFTDLRKEEKKDAAVKSFDPHKGFRRRDWNVCK